MSVLTATRPLTLVNQSGRVLDSVLSGVVDQISVIEQSRDTPQPWEIGGADILVTGPSWAWKNAPAAAPASWGPGPDWVHILSAGVDGFPDWLLRSPRVTCGRGDAANPVAEYALTAMLMHEKRLNELAPRGAADWPSGKFDLSVGSLEGKTLGLAGYGAIGRAVARRAQAFDMRIAAWRRGAWPDNESRGISIAKTLHELIEISDHLVLVLPLTRETLRCVDGALLARAKPGLHLVNVARGGLVDENALLGALETGLLSAATLDVTDQEPLPDGHPFYANKNIRLTPHVSWVGPRVAAASIQRFEDNLKRFLSGQPLLDVVDPDRGY